MCSSPVPPSKSFIRPCGRCPLLPDFWAGRKGTCFCLCRKEAAWLEQTTGGGTEASLSLVKVIEGDGIRILSGPLKDMEGRIRKINLHKRTAEVEVDFMNRKTVVHLGIEMVGKGSVPPKGNEPAQEKT